MAENTRKLTVPAWFVAAGAAIGVLALLVAVVSCTGEGFGMKELPMVALLTLAAVLLCAGILLIARSRGDNVFVTVMVFLMVIALAFCVYQMIMGKSDVFGTVLFSDLEKGYAPAERATWLGIVSIVMYMAATLVTAIGAFCTLSKKA